MPSGGVHPISTGCRVSLWQDALAPEVRYELQRAIRPSFYGREFLFDIERINNMLHTLLAIALLTLQSLAGALI